MMEWRIVTDDEMGGRKPLDIGMVRIGTLPDGRGIYDCANSVVLGIQISRGRQRRERAPWWVRRHVDTSHMWAGE